MTNIYFKRLFIVLLVTIFGGKLFSAPIIGQKNGDPTIEENRACDDILKTTKKLDVLGQFGKDPLSTTFYKATSKLPHSLRTLLFDFIRENIENVDSMFAISDLLLLAGSEPKYFYDSVVDYLSRFETPLVRSQIIAEIGDYTGENAKLKTPYSEAADIADFRVEPGQKLTYDDFIKYDLFSDPLRFGTWWINPELVADISGVTSSGPIRKAYGLAAKRLIYWPTISNFDNQPAIKGGASKDQLRISVNFDETGKPSTLEGFAKDTQGQWFPFVYVREEQLWKPAKSFLGEPISVACAKCHQYPNGQFHPKPNFLKSTLDLTRSGYLQESAETIMDEFNKWINLNP